MVEITIASEATPNSAAMERLVPQLSKSNPPPSMEALDTLCRSEASTMFIATDETGILGTLTLAMFRIPTGIRRGSRMSSSTTPLAARGGATPQRSGDRPRIRRGGDHRRPDLSPVREAANRLYQRIGFVQRETNVYRYSKPEQLES